MTTESEMRLPCATGVDLFVATHADRNRPIYEASWEADRSREGRVKLQMRIRRRRHDPRPTLHSRPWTLRGGASRTCPSGRLPRDLMGPQPTTSRHPGPADATKALALPLPLGRGARALRREGESTTQAPRDAPPAGRAAPSSATSLWTRDGAPVCGIARPRRPEARRERRR